MSGNKTWGALALDRTAVLSLGIVAGFAIGVSFNPAARRGIAATLTGTAPASEAAPAPELGPATATIAPRAAPHAARPAFTLPPAALARAAAGQPVRVGVFGDSYGVGIWAALHQDLPASAGFDVLRFGKEATGFTRYRTLDLEQRAREQIAERPIDIAVISFGANDIQPVFAEGHLHALMDAGWQRIIGERIDRFVATVRRGGAAAYWIGLPVMRDPDLDANVRAMNAFYAARMKALGVPFYDTRAASLDAAGRYDRYLPDPRTGQPVAMRLPDGIHMTFQGYERITAALSGPLRAAVARAAHRTPPPPPIAAPRATPAPTATPVPTPPHAAAKPHPDPEGGSAARANRREHKEETAPTPTPPPAAAPAAEPAANAAEAPR